MDNRARNFLGKALLYRDLNNLESRTVLRRNLRDVLDSHERDLEREKSDATGNQQHQESVDRPRPVWEPPSDRMMEQLSKYQKPVLRISSLHLRNPKDPRQPRNTNEPSWLPQFGEFIRSCQVMVTLWDRRAGSSTNAPLCKKLSQGRIVGRDNSNGRISYDILLQEPLEVQIDEVFCASPSFTGKGPWDRRLDEDCVLEFGIQFEDSDSTAEFLTKIEGRPLDEYRTAGANEGIVKIKWSKLPQLPKDGEILPMKRAKGHKSLDLQYGAEIVMGWSERLDRPLTRHSKAVQRKQEQMRQFPTPVSEDLEAGRGKCFIKYNFRHAAFEMRSMVTDHLKCIFCEHDSEHTSFDRLYLHYKLNHDHFDFSLDEPRKGVKAIRIDHADDKDGSKGFAWIAPTRTLDLDSHVRDNSEWTESWWEIDDRLEGTPRKRKEKHVVRTTTGKSPTTKLPLQRLQGLKIANPKRKFTEPEEVQDLVPQLRKKHIVPDVPGVVFYRTTSKQILRPGDEISDSDGELDDTWMKQSQRRDLKKLGHDGVSLDFNELFNRHLDEEGPMSDTLTSDAIVRFARKWVDLLKDAKWKEKFAAKLKQLETRRILRHETVKYCLDLVEAAAKKAASEPAKEKTGQTSATRQHEGLQKRAGTMPSTPSRDVVPVPQTTNHTGKIRMRWVDGALQLTDEQGVPVPTQKPATAEGVGAKDGASAEESKQVTAPLGSRPPLKPCVCGERIKGKRGTIACANVKCGTQGFHMACVKLENRVWGWKCSGCSSS